MMEGSPKEPARGASQEPKLRAVALEYQGAEGEAQGAPKVRAKGTGHAAQRILDVAEEHSIPVHHDADLVGLLGHCDIGDEIPAALYGAVAEVLVWLHVANGQKP